MVCTCTYHTDSSCNRKRLLDTIYLDLVGITGGTTGRIVIIAALHFYTTDKDGCCLAIRWKAEKCIGQPETRIKVRFSEWYWRHKTKISWIRLLTSGIEAFCRALTLWRHDEGDDGEIGGGWDDEADIVVNITRPRNFSILQTWKIPRLTRPMRRYWEFQVPERRRKRKV